MQTYYDGAHSIIFCPVTTFRDENESAIDPVVNPNFGGKHTWEDWGLVPLSRPYVSPPKVKTNTLEINGANGVVDLTEVPLGFPTYQNRTGSWEFAMANDRVFTEGGQPLPWDKHLELIMGYLHGRTVALVLTDDMSYYYSGRVQITQVSADTMYTKITMEYDLYPYKRMIWTTTGPWKWDPFDFLYGETGHYEIFNDRVLNSDSSSEQLIIGLTPDLAGNEPVIPTIIFESSDTKSCTMAINNVDYEATGARHFTIPDGKTRNPQIMIVCPYPNDKCYLSFYNGHGKISIQFRPGRL